MPETTPPSIAVTTTTTTVKPGWLTSEHLMMLITLILVSLQGSGIIPIDSVAAKCVAMALTILGGLGYTAARTFLKTSAMLVVVAFAFHSTACGASTQEKLLQDTLAAANAARIAFATYDGIHQHQLVASAKSEAEGEKSLDAWQATQLTVEKLFDALYRGIATAAVLKNDDAFKSMDAAKTALRDELALLRVVQL